VSVTGSVDPPTRRTVSGADAAPIPVQEDALVISDNADIYGTVADLRGRLLVRG
jgi:hypothetical protein